MLAHTRHHFVLNVDTRTVRTSLDCSGQMTFGWLDPLFANGSTIPVGKCNLYTYPFVTFSSGQTVVPADLEPLKQCLAAALSDPACSYFEKSDEVG